MAANTAYTRAYFLYPHSCPYCPRSWVLGAGDTWSPHQRRYLANGYCGDRIYPFDWNSLDRNADHVTDLEVFIDSVRTANQATQVDLVGHSAGGGLGYEYLANEERAQTVRRYVHIGSFPSDAPPGPDGGDTVPTLNLWSEQDVIVGEPIYLGQPT